MSAQNFSCTNLMLHSSRTKLAQSGMTGKHAGSVMQLSVAVFQFNWLHTKENVCNLCSFLMTSLGKVCTTLTKIKPTTTFSAVVLF